jgi:UDP-glucose-4-epimerase GalE
LELGNIADSARLREVLRRYRPLAVIHFAGFGYVGESMESPDLYYGNNVIRTGQMLETLRHAGIRHIVFSSSCATYGGVHSRTIDESVEQRPLSTYGFSKLVIEHMLTDYGRAFGFRSLALRYFNAAGADPEGDLGECHDPEPHFVPRVLRVAAGHERVIQLNGNDYPTPDGTCVRDYVHVHDLARGHVLAVRAIVEGGITGAVNLGTGRGSSLMEIVNVVGRVTGRRITTEIAPRRDGDPAYAVADARRAAELLGWTPAYTNMDQTIGHAWSWMCNRAARVNESASPHATAGRP